MPEVRSSCRRDDADKRVCIFLRLLGVRCEVETKAGGLLCVLQLRIGAVSATTAGRWGLRVGARVFGRKARFTADYTVTNDADQRRCHEMHRRNRSRSASRAGIAARSLLLCARRTDQFNRVDVVHPADAVSDIRISISRRIFIQT